MSRANHNLNRLLDKPGMINGGGYGKIDLDNISRLRYLEDTFFEMCIDENQQVTYLIN